MKRITSILVCLAFISLSAIAQDIQITGKVTSADDGSALPGVSVVIKGTQTGVASNIDGDYSITAPSDAVLVFTSIGMQIQEVTVGGQTTLNVAMDAEVTGLDEVVVTAYGITREKKAIAYQTENVGSEELQQAQSNDLASGLVGKVAGLQVNIQDNGVKPNTQVLLRGLRSISSNNEATIVIDGAIASTGALNDLNPNDVESVQVLKGATSAALYGSDAANGAMIITTKSGAKNGTMTVGITHSTTIEEVAFMPDFQSEHGIGWDGDYNNIENTNWGPRFDGQLRQVGPTMPEGHAVPTQMVPYAPIKNNLYDFYDRGLTQRNTVYVSGGDENGSFYMSAGNQNTTGIIPDDTYKRYTFRVNADKKIGKVKLTANTQYFSDERDVTGDQIGDQDRPLYWFVLNTPANIPLTSYKDYTNPESYGYADNYFNAYYQNPYWAIGTNRDNDKTTRIVANLSASWDILDNINFTTRAGVNNVSSRGKNWRAFQDYDANLQPFHTTVSSFVEDEEYKRANYTFDAILNGDFNLSEDIGLKAILGASVITKSYSDTYIRANNLSIPDFYDISNGTGEKTAVADAEQRRTVGFFADVALNYKKFIYLNASARQDYTSTLAQDNNGYLYPAFGVSFILTEAIPSLKNDILTFAKITANNSTVYQDLDPYDINERYTQAAVGGGRPDFPFPYGSVNGFYKARTAVDKDIKKEKLNSTEIGANVALFPGGRLELDAVYFITKTTDLITSTTPSRAAGAEFYLTNIGELEGKGFELTVGGTPLQFGDFKWHVDLSYSQSETKVVEIAEGIDETFVQSYLAGYGIYAVVGEAFPTLKATAYVRDPEGRVVVDGVSGDPLVGEVENMGKTTPDYIMAGSTSLSFKGLSVRATVDYRAGHVYYSQGSDAMEFTGRSMDGISSGRKDFVFPNSVIETSPGVYVENTDVQITGGRMDFWQNRYNEIKENYVKNGDVFKLRELSVSYDLPSNIIDKTGFVKKVSVSLIGRNLLTVFPKTKYRFSDPEFNNTRNNMQNSDPDNSIGIGGYFSGPPTRSYGFSVNVEF